MLMLKQSTIHDLDHVGDSHFKLTSASALPGWLGSIGTLVSTFLPIFVTVWHALGPLLVTVPTAAQFFAKGAELHPLSPEEAAAMKKAA